jgi:EAL domain-containing protein (putative c-di-GMP-specific phosphodiesterase class I)
MKVVYRFRYVLIHLLRRPIRLVGYKNMPHITYLPHSCERFVDSEFDRDPLLQQVGMGFCIAGGDGRIHAANQKMYTLFEEYQGGFCRWWSKMAGVLVKNHGSDLMNPRAVTHTWSTMSKEKRSVLVWVFAAGNQGDTVFLLIVEKTCSQTCTADDRIQPSFPGIDSHDLLTQDVSNECMMQALSDSLFSVRYQPIYDIRMGRVAGFEARIQWDAGKHASLPADFFRLLDASGGSLLLGMWFLGKVCDDFRRWKENARDADHCFVQLRLSQGQMNSLCILHVLQHCLAANGLDASDVWIKAPKESFETHDTAKQLLLHRYHVLGVNFIVDRLRTNLTDLSYFFAFSVIPFKAVHLGNYALGSGRSTRQFELFATFAKIFSSLGIHVLTLYSGGSSIAEALRTTKCRYIQKQDGSQSLTASQVPAFIGSSPSFFSGHDRLVSQ